MDEAHSSVNHDVILPILYNVRKALQDFTEMFQTKVQRNFSLATKSTLSINKYLEEFPGLVHFLYIDRVTHRFVAPSLDFNSPETTNLTKKKVIDRYFILQSIWTIQYLFDYFCHRFGRCSNSLDRIYKRDIYT